MALILCIETSGQTASVALVNNGCCVSLRENTIRNEHGAFLQPAVREIMTEAGFALTQIDAVAVSIGPGSYTGLRVGLASAKGICYALNKPLIQIGTLTLMATVARELLSDLQKEENYCIVPMIDARRNEVFSATFDHQLNNISEPGALILEENSFEAFLSVPIYFTGDGSVKWQSQCNHANARFITIDFNAADMSSIAQKMYQNQQFTPAALAIPLYGKAFYTTQPKIS
jgi:tRNA threonylcarbamoyladenosine biosynthesis protein TsaB